MSDTDLDLPEFEQSQTEANALATTQPTPPDAPTEAGETNNKTATDLHTVFDVPVSISAVLGKSYMDVASLMKLDAGSVLELDRKVGEAIDIFVNNRLVARGEIVLIDDRLGVTMTEIIKDHDAS